MEVFLGLELLQTHIEKDNGDAESIDILRSLRESCSTAVEILNELLQYEKIEAGLMTLEREFVYPLPFIAKACAPFLIQAQQKGINMAILKGDLEAQATTYLRHWRVSIDQSKMSQVLRNFCSNALKFTPPGGSVQIAVQLVEEYEGPTYLRIEVKDSGHGIALENQHKVFNEVVQFHANKQQGGGGSGFGLVICRKIVELHGGRVGLVSEGEGKGSMFFVELQTWKSDPDPSEYTAVVSACAPKSSMSLINLEQKHTSGKIPLRGSVIRRQSAIRVLKVLVVDDSAMNRKMTRKMLEYLGHFVVEADDGEAAIELCKTTMKDGSMFDMILMDNHMPRMSGPETTSVLRKLGYSGYIAALTGDTSPEDEEHFSRSGADIVLIKPINREMFERVIRDLRRHAVQFEEKIDENFEEEEEEVVY